MHVLEEELRNLLDYTVYEHTCFVWYPDELVDLMAQRIADQFDIRKYLALNQLDRPLPIGSLVANLFVSISVVEITCVNSKINTHQ